LFIFDDSIPGYASRDEAKAIYDILNAHAPTDILEIGPYTGKLTWALCASLPDCHITALDQWPGDSDEIFEPGNPYSNSKYFGCRNNLDLFMSFNHKHKNLLPIQSDFLDYYKKHQILLLSLDGGSVMNWPKVFNHALSFDPQLIIGRHAWPHRADITGPLSNFRHKLLNHGLYILERS